MRFLIAIGLAAGGAARAADETAAKATSAQPDADAANLAAKVQNPVANLISVPFQENLDYQIGPEDRARSTLNIQPVIPIELSESWNLITRTIWPIIYQPNVQSQTGGSSGIGDLNPTAFLSPAKPGRLIWGTGPTLSLPTATQRATGSGKWAAGVAVVVLAQPKPWTLGVLVNNLWSFAGPDDRASVNLMTLQYFINYNLAHAWYLASQPIINADWTATSNERWLVPAGGGLGKIFKVGPLPLNGQLTAYYNVVRPDQTPSPRWQLRVQVAMLFPK